MLPLRDTLVTISKASYAIASIALLDHTDYEGYGAAIRTAWDASKQASDLARERGASAPPTQQAAEETGR